MLSGALETCALSNAPEVNLAMWAEKHRLPFCWLHDNAEAMADLGGPMTEVQSNAKFDRYANAWFDHGISRWALEDKNSNFVGYCGVMYRPDISHPLGAHHEIGWRLIPSVWGKGYACKAAVLAFDHAWATIRPMEILSYTAPDNIRSQNVMSRLGLTRCPSRDFFASYDPFPKPWHGLVWAVQRP